MLAKICYGWAVVESNFIELGGRLGCRLRLTENSFCPGQEILWYPQELIKEFEE